MANGQPTENGLPQRAGTTNPDWNSYVPRGEGRTDEQIRADIHQKLAAEDGEHTKGLSIEVANGTVTLRGGASTPAERQRIEALIRSVPSVREVRDELSAGESSSGAGQIARGYAAVRDRAVEGAHAVQHTASDLSARTQDYAAQLGSRAQDYARRTGVRTAQGARDVGGFVTTHAVPLALVSASLAYLAWSIRRQSDRMVELPIVTYERRPQRLEADYRSAPEYRAAPQYRNAPDYRQTADYRRDEQFGQSRYETDYPRSRFET